MTIPTALLRECIYEILSILSKVVNLSLQLNDTANILAKAIRKSMLKKVGLEHIRSMSNLYYRFMSNLTFVLVRTNRKK